MQKVRKGKFCYTRGISFTLNLLNYIKYYSQYRNNKHTNIQHNLQKNSEGFKFEVKEVSAYFVIFNCNYLSG